MRLRIRRSPFIALLALFASPLIADADQVLVGNLDEPPVEAAMVIQEGVFGAQEFTTGVSANLTSIITNLGDLGTPDGDFPIVAQLISVTAIGDTPDMGTVVDTLTLKGGLSSIPFLGFANVEFDPKRPTASVAACSITSSSASPQVPTRAFSIGITPYRPRWMGPERFPTPRRPWEVNQVHGHRSGRTVLDPDQRRGRARAELVDSGEHGLPGGGSCRP